MEVFAKKRQLDLKEDRRKIQKMYNGICKRLQEENTTFAKLNLADVGLSHMEAYFVIILKKNERTFAKSGTRFIIGELL